MPRYDVHIYAIARRKVSGVDADSAQDAARKAERLVDLHQEISAGHAEYADGIEGFLVDLLDNNEQRVEVQSRYFTSKEVEQSPDKRFSSP